MSKKIPSEQSCFNCSKYNFDFGCDEEPKKTPCEFWVKKKEPLGAAGAVRQIARIIEDEKNLKLLKDPQYRSMLARMIRGIASDIDRAVSSLTT